MQIPINVKHLKAVALFSAVNDIRYYLNGVLIEVLPNAVRIVATDGNLMAIAHHEVKHAIPPCQFIIPSSAVATAIKSTGKACEFIFGEPADANYIAQVVTPCVLHAGDTDVRFTPVDGKFPDYRRVFPDKCSGDVGHFNPEYIMRFQKAAMVYNKNRLACVTIEHNGNGPAIVHGVDEEFCGVIMPMRASFTAGLPAWFK